MAVYAVFATIATGVLSTVSGPPAQRTRTYLAALSAGLALVTIGTATARSTPLAVVGMLAVGFIVAYVEVGGPRLAAIANGLQLCYILPCFPPYDPGSLPQRLAGLAIGILFTACADRLLWPEPAPPAVADTLADAIDTVTRGVTAIRRGDVDAALDCAGAAMAALRIGMAPTRERPTGAGHRDRGAAHAAVQLLGLIQHLDLLAHLRTRTPDPLMHGAADVLLAELARTLDGCAAALRSIGAPPRGGRLVAAAEHYLDSRAASIPVPTGSVDLPATTLAIGLVGALAESACGLVAAVRAAIGAGRDPTTPPTVSAWYVDLPTLVLWWRRLRSHLTPRSVYFQNAVRLAAGLAAARLVAGVLDLSHGFWVLLTTLSLMRTSLVANGLALVPALLGTLGGAVVGAGVLELLGDHTGLYAAAFPFVMIAAFAAGPLLGPAASQFGFTVLVSVLFAQLAPVSWQLDEVRLVDVVVGGLVGAVIGAAVWPRGGAGEVHRAAAEGLNAVADIIVATVRGITDGRPPDPPVAIERHLALFYDTVAQYRSEPRHPRAAGWMIVLGLVERAAVDAQVLLGRHPDPDPLPWPAVTERLTATAVTTSDAYHTAAGTLGSNARTSRAAGGLTALLDAAPPQAPFGDDPHATLRVIDLWSWLCGLADSLTLAEAAAADHGRS